MESRNRIACDFLSSLSHEIRTPLNGIVGYSQLLSQTKIDTTQKGYIEAINKCSIQLIELVNDILDFSKLTAGGATVSNSCFSIKEIVIEVASILGYRFREKKQKFRHVIHNTVPEYIITDKVKLVQILVNLLSNSNKFSPAGGRIILAINSSSENTLIFSIEDDGIGISGEDQKKLFTPFFQVQESSTQKGSGLGLAITKKLVGLLGGEISVESDKGKGSVFSFTITTQSYKEYERLVEETTHRIKGKYILVADENVDDRLGVGEILFEAGLRPIICSSDKEVLSLVSAQRYTFSAIVLSATFPASSVLENLKHVRENIPVVITAENTQEKWTSENVVITKPVNKIQLLDTLLKLINKDSIDDCQLNDIKPDKIPKRDVSILIAEDNTYNADILVKMLNTIGYNKIDVAFDGSEAVKKIDEQYDLNKPYNVLLLDLKMPVMDGIEVAHHIHANKYEDLKTVVITSSVAESDKAKCKELGVKYFLLKPYSMTQLKLFMNKMLE